jgi:hypothetical protein
VAHFTNGTQRLVVLTTQVPIVPQAIQIQFMGSEGSQARLTNDLQSLVASLDGSTNWTSAAQVHPTLGSLANNRSTMVKSHERRSVRWLSAAMTLGSSRLSD